jgi:hypothetical protein
VPPLDGAAVVEGLFQKQAGRFYQMVRESPGLGILMFLGVWYVFPEFHGAIEGPFLLFAEFVLQL